MGTAMVHSRLALPFLSVLLAAGCVAAPEPAAPAPAAVAPPAPPVAAPDWQDRTLTAGGWRYRPAPGGSQAVFGADLAILSCRPARRQVTLAATGWAGQSVTIRTTSATRQLTAGSDGAVVLAATDPLLDAMAFSRGRFTVEAPGRVPLVLPAHAEIGRVIEDCRG